MDRNIALKVQNLEGLKVQEGENGPGDGEPQGNGVQAGQNGQPGQDGLNGGGGQPKVHLVDSSRSISAARKILFAYGYKVVDYKKNIEGAFTPAAFGKITQSETELAFGEVLNGLNKQKKFKWERALGELADDGKACIVEIFEGKQVGDIVDFGVNLQGEKVHVKVSQELLNEVNEMKEAISQVDINATDSENVSEQSENSEGEESEVEELALEREKVQKRKSILKVLVDIVGSSTAAGGMLREGELSAFSVDDIDESNIKTEDELQKYLRETFTVTALKSMEAVLYYDQINVEDQDMKGEFISIFRRLVPQEQLLRN